MLFNSFAFLVFFPVVTGLYFALPHRFRWMLLLLASCIFYMFFRPVYILILFFTIVIDYFAGIWIEGAEGKQKRKYLIMSLIANIGVLAVFKYWNFGAQNFNLLFDFMRVPVEAPLLKIMLPIGLSFHTFQAMSYTIEVYRGKQRAERHFGIYSLYVMYWPQLVAGPIERPQNILHQLREKFDFEYDRVTSGIRLMAWGFFKKVVIADRLAVFVSEVYNHPQDYAGLPLVIGTLFFSFQIYCDFSGYSDIAIGASRVMGIKLMENFRRPYRSRSISEFWRRWHISLSTWFRDYLYIPLGGNRATLPRVYFNMFFVFMVSGFWHGANWTFVIWGMLHGFYLIFALWTEGAKTRLRGFFGLEKRPRLDAWQQVLVTFVLVALAWVFFRAKTVGDALHILSHLHTGFVSQVSAVISSLTARETFLYLGQPAVIFWAGVLSIGFLLAAENWIEKSPGVQEMFKKQPAVLRWSVYLAGLWAIAVFGEFRETEFIYFQF